MRSGEGGEGLVVVGFICLLVAYSHFGWIFCLFTPCLFCSICLLLHKNLQKIHLFSTFSVIFFISLLLWHPSPVPSEPFINLLCTCEGTSLLFLLISYITSRMC